ncbi:MAG: prepilin-type N-terminal cleavage/methylation domain-containing protein [Candidatus Gastranaerophilaceae bacterium]
MLVKKGFTLSEVMVTLGLIGVLAAILIPTITRTAPDSKKIMFKKAYYTTEQTIRMLINDDAFYPATATTKISGVVYQRGFNYTDVTDGMNIPASTNKFCYLFSQRLKTVGTVSCPSAYMTNGKFTTADGMTWIIHQSFMAPDFPVNNNAYLKFIIVDINGSKKPNCSAVDIGELLDIAVCPASVSVPDTFSITVRYDGDLHVDDSGAALLENPTDNAK